MRCPKCDCEYNFLVASGRDYLHHLPGTSYVTECRRWGFWFQNPAPPRNHLAQLYPAEYGPHTKVEDRKPPSFCQDQARYFQRRLGYPAGLVAPSRANHWSARIRGESFRHWVTGVEMVPRYVPEGRLLEIGCGSGGRLLYLRSLGWRHLHGIELVPQAAAQAQAEGIQVEYGMVEEVLESYPPGYFDVIIASMVLEHLYNPFKVVRQIAEKLRGGGQFLFSTVVRDSLEAKRYQNYWAGFDFPRHLVFFRHEDIKDMLAADFEAVEYFHHAAPQDFIRSSTWRYDDGKGTAWDRLVITLGKSKPARLLQIALALAGKTCRVSFRCLKRDAGNGS